MKHTPGPWVVSTTDDACDMYDIDGIGVYAARDLAGVDAGECGSALAYVSENWGEHKANASLMAAAPDLLDALREARAELLYWHPHCGPDTPLQDQQPAGPSRVVAKIDAAIAKAEGRDV